MYIPFHDISDEDFERMVFLICRHILGEGAEFFGKGKDEGIDVYFEGEAEKLKPMRGKFVVQAKHTNRLGASCGDTQFFSDSKNSLIRKEIDKVKKLYADGRMDYYFLFTNRTKFVTSINKIKKYISAEVGIPESNVRIYSYEEIAQWHADYEDVAECVKFPSIKRELDCSVDEFLDVVNAVMSWASAENDEVLPAVEITEIQRVAFRKKNELNQVDVYESDFLLKNYLAQEGNFQSILSVPSHVDIRRLYYDAAREAQRKVLSYMRKGHTFMDAFNEIVDCLMRYNNDLRRNKKMCEEILFFMYFNCDVGRREDINDSDKT